MHLGKNGNDSVCHISRTGRDRGKSNITYETNAREFIPFKKLT